MLQAQVLMVLWALAPHSLVYIKGHSRAAERARVKIETFTCYSSGKEPESSAAILQVDHLLSDAGRSWIVIVLTDHQNHVLYEKKAEEHPWPMPSTLDGLLKNLARSTCPGYQGTHPTKPPPHKRPETVSQSELPTDDMIDPPPK